MKTYAQLANEALEVLTAWENCHDTGCDMCIHIDKVAVFAKDSCPDSAVFIRHFTPYEIQKGLTPKGWDRLNDKLIIAYTKGQKCKQNHKL